MKRRITLSIVLVLSVVLLSSASSDSTVQAQQQQRQRFTADTGVVTLGPNQMLRLTINGGAGNDAITVRLRRMEYSQNACSGGVCKLAVASQSTSAPVTLMPGEAASFEIDPAPNGELQRAVRGVILGRGLTKDLTGTLLIIDKTTGQVNSIIAILIAL